MIEIRTIIGYGSPKVAGTNKAHGAPLGAEEGKATKQAYNWLYEEDFFVPEEVKENFAQIKRKGIDTEQNWNNLFQSYKQAYPELADQLTDAINGKVLIDTKDIINV